MDGLAGLRPPIAFVLGGGGALGAVQVGMMAALASAGVRPDLVVGASVGAINGALIAADPASGVERLRALWQEVREQRLLDEGVVARLRTLRRTGVSVRSSGLLAAVLERVLGAGTRIEDLPVPFGCVAACIETAGATWFERGPLVPALLASSAVPGLFEPVRIGRRHYLDGGLVDSIPVARAVERGARTIFVLQVGRIERPLTLPTNPAELALVVFEIARRHRFATFMEDLPGEVTVHVLPTGGPLPKSVEGRPNFGSRDRTGVGERIQRAEAASCRYLEATGLVAGGRA